MKTTTVNITIETTTPSHVDRVLFEAIQRAVLDRADKIAEAVKEMI